jgi:hypothetical protein
MVDPIWQPDTVVAGLATWLDGVLPVSMGGKAITTYHNGPPADAVVPFVLVTVPPGSAPVAAAAVSGFHDILHLVLGVRAVCATEAETNALFGIIRARMAARSRTGFVTPMVLASAKVMDRVANYDGSPDLVGGLWQQFETFEITYQRP